MENKWESSFSRAKRDTLSVFSTVRFWLFELLWVAIITIIVILWQPSWAKEGVAMTSYQILVPVVGAILGLAIVFLIFLLFIVPCHQRNEARKIVDLREEQLKPKLNVSIEYEPVPTADDMSNRGYFWRLKVTNISKNTISKCYGMIRRCYVVNNNVLIDYNNFPNLPREGQFLPWARESGGGYEHTFGSGEPAYLDYVMIYKIQDSVLRVPASPDSLDERPNYNRFVIGSDKLQFEITIGTRDSIMEASVIKFLFNYEQGNVAQITEISNSSPPIPDKVDSQN